MKRIIATLIVLTPLAATAGEYRTVTWFADHPTERHEVLRMCRDNAALAPHNPNCINAEEAGTLALQRELDAINNRPVQDATKPAYWRDHPQEMAEQLSKCRWLTTNKSPMSPTMVTWCAAAKGAAFQ